MLTIPFIKSSKGLKFVAVEQRRIVNGKFSTEFPSGGVGNSTSPIIAANKELREETGIFVDCERLKPLSPELVVCESSFSEVVLWFSCLLKEEELPIDGKNFGVDSENEHTKIRLVTLEEIKKINSFHMITACELLSRSGHI